MGRKGIEIFGVDAGAGAIAIDESLAFSASFFGPSSKDYFDGR